MRKSRIQRGFSLIELLVVVLIIGVLAAIAMPNFSGAQSRAKLAGVKSNMHTVQLAAQAYATETGGVCGTLAQCGPYFPGGASVVGGAAGSYPTNPFSGVRNQTPDSLTFADATAVQAAKAAAAGATTGTPGNSGYAKTGDGNSYAVLGFDQSGKSVAGGGIRQLCLSNN